MATKRVQYEFRIDAFTCDLNQELANAASSWFHSHTGAELAEIYQRILRANAIWCMRLGLGFKFPNRRMKPLDQAI